MRQVVLVVAALGALVGCRDVQRISAPARISADFSDGTVANGNPHFFLLPPLVPMPSFSGVFNSALRPVVEICQLNVDVSNLPLGCNLTLPAIIPGIVQLDLVDQQYWVDWDTGALGVGLLTSAPLLFYRIQVRVAPGGTAVGFADVAVVSNGGALQNVNTGQYIGLVGGRTLPIKFRLESGAFCQTTDCFEGTVGTAGGTFLTSTALAGTLFPPGALNQDVLLVIDRVDQQPCVPADVPQFKGCYRFSADPRPPQFNTPVIVAMCVDAPGLSHAQHDLLHIYQSDPGLPVQSLLNVPAPFLPCDPGHLIGSRLPRGLRELARFLDRMLLPTTLHAAHTGVGGSTTSYSVFGWALPAQLSSNDGDNQAAAVGSAVATAPSVVVKDSSGAPVAGATVTFTVVAGGGSITNPVAVTGTDGIARVGSWMLGRQAGGNILAATTAGAANSVVTFRAAGMAGMATQIVLNGGNNQTTTVGTPVTTPPSVVVLDQFNNPVAGVAVTFTVTSGGGVVSPTTSVATSASGIAAATSWTLGPAAGTNTLTATATGLAGSPVTFSAAASVPPLLPP
jgi:hypothetical protein